MSEISGFLYGGLTVLISVEESMLAAWIGKMFQQCMFANFIWKNVQVIALLYFTLVVFQYIRLLTGKPLTGTTSLTERLPKDYNK